MKLKIIMPTVLAGILSIGILAAGCGNHEEEPAGRVVDLDERSGAGDLNEPDLVEDTGAEINETSGSVPGAPPAGTTGAHVPDEQAATGRGEAKVPEEVIQDLSDAVIEERAPVGSAPESTTAGSPPAMPNPGGLAADGQGANSRGEKPVQVTLEDFSINMPATLPPGQTTFQVANKGGAEHNFEVEGPGMEKELEQNLKPGQNGSLSVKLEPGEYRVYCPVADHAERGMEMTLKVEQPSP